MSIWNNCIVKLQDRLLDVEFTTWIKPLQAEEIDEKTLILYAPNRFIVDYVQVNHLPMIIEIIQHVTKNESFIVKIIEGSQKQQKKINTEKDSNSKSEKNISYKIKLNKNYKFHNFVEGKSNELAKAVAIQVAKNIGSTQSNPFFLYGGTGLGKTHLLHAIGNAMLAGDSKLHVLYTHSEAFVQDMVKAIQNNKMEQFQQFYRSANILLIDDIQFFADKGRSQEVFFHTFNALFEAGNQIVLTSDRYPKEIDKIEDRLKSRFSWGLSIAIEPPDLETRVAILLQKAVEFKVNLPKEIALFIGQKLKTNVRELEGALNKVNAYSSFTGKSIDYDTVREALKDMLAAQEKSITIENIQKVVAEYFKIKVSDLKSKSRKRTVTRPRQIAMTLAKELTNRSLPEIGKNFGDRDHTTVLHAYKTIYELKETDINIKEDFTNLIRTLSV